MTGPIKSSGSAHWYRAGSTLPKAARTKKTAMAVPRMAMRSKKHSMDFCGERPQARSALTQKGNCFMLRGAVPIADTTFGRVGRAVAKGNLTQTR